MKRKTLLLGILLVAIVMLVVVSTAFAAGPSPAPVCRDRNLQGGPQEQPTDTSKMFFPYLVSPCENFVVKQVPYQAEWANSAHNDVTAPAFTFWNNTTTYPNGIPVECAKCHSTPGYQDYIGLDGSRNKDNVTTSPSPIGTTVYCVACHNPVGDNKSDVTFLSGKAITGLGKESNCIECHQGDSSLVQVNDEITAAALANDDTASATLVWTDVAPHYFTAAISMYGKEVAGGYQYQTVEVVDDEEVVTPIYGPYDVRFQHVEGYTACQSCHNQHSLGIRLEKCAECHRAEDVTSQEALRNIRMPGSLADYDGDGNITEGMYYEVKGLRDMLYTAIQSYATQVALKSIVYDGDVYPYWFIDTNGNGVVDPGEATFANQYKSFTNRLLKAAYNYQVSIKDPGQYAHGGKYIIELLHDSIADLNVKITPVVDLSKAARVDPGHFASSKEPWRHWDNAVEPLNGEVQLSCAKCHSALGVPTLVKNGVSTTLTASNGVTSTLSIIQPVTSALMCTTCHATQDHEWDRLPVSTVVFPSGASLSFADPNKDANLCMLCHQGRQSTASVNFRIAGKPDDTVMTGSSNSFLNVHYYAAGATLWGNDAKGMYQYTGNTYAGRNVHVPTFDACTECHDTHKLAVKYTLCGGCHPVVTSEATLRDIRWFADVTDWDGDGNVTEGVYYEIDTMATALYAAIQSYATTVAGTPIAYTPLENPYWFIDTNGNGVVDPDEIGVDGANRYNKWTPRLLRNAYNYQYVNKDPGDFAHNPKYVIQELYDNLTDMSQKVTVPGLANMHRP